LASQPDIVDAAAARDSSYQELQLDPRHPSFFVSMQRLGRAPGLHLPVSMHAAKRFVYLLRNLEKPSRSYVGVTANVAERLASHNAGRSPFTAKYKPWELIVSVEFPDEARALTFEKYLKSGSGSAFAKRHFT
jgi:putative endonuclease